MPAALNATDASIVKGMLARGDMQHHIAAWFGVNPGRVADVKTGKKYPHVVPAPADALPPPGPYIAKRLDLPIEDQLQRALAEFDLKWSRELARTAQERRQTNEKIDMLIRILAETRRDLTLIDTTAPKPTRRRPTP